MADEQALPFVLRVLEGDLKNRVLQDGQPPGTIVLAGRALPQGSFTIEGDQRMKTTWYGGNPKGRQQAIGPVEQPTTISGVWKDKLLGAGGQTIALARLFIDIRRRAPLVELSWGAGYLGTAGSPLLSDPSIIGDPFTLQGLLKKTKFDFENPSKASWALTFEWNGFDELTSAPVMATGIVNPREGLANATSALDTLHDTTAAFRNFVQTRLVGFSDVVEASLNDYLAAVDDASDAVKGATAAAARIAQNEPAQAILGSLSNAVDAATSMRSLLEVLVPSQLVATDSALGILEFRSNVLVLLGLADTAKKTCSESVDSMGRSSSPDVIAEVRPPAGTDLRVLAIQYYNDPDGWVEIARYNGIDGSAVPPNPTGPSDSSGAPIKIPKRGGNAGLAGGC